MDNLKKYYFVAHDWVLDHKKISGFAAILLVGIVLGKLL